MALPIRTTLDDIEQLCKYLAKKPMGATIQEARTVLDSKYLDGRKLSALKAWGLVEEHDGRLKLREEGRLLVKDPASSGAVFARIVQSVRPYNALVERVAHRKETDIAATDVAAYWHEHFAHEVADSEKILNDQAVCFFQIATGAELGKIVIGRRGSSTRFEFNAAALALFIGDSVEEKSRNGEAESPELELANNNVEPRDSRTDQPGEKPGVAELGQAIFVGHGKNKKPLEQLKRILEQFKIPFRVATEEPNLGRPIGSKVREVMESCNCAIMIFTADEEFRDPDGKEIWRPSENVVYELGAAGFLYGSRIVIMKEEEVAFPANFQDLGYISFSKDQLEAKAMEVLKELIGFGIVKVTT